MKKIIDYLKNNSEIIFIISFCLIFIISFFFMFYDVYEDELLNQQKDCYDYYLKNNYVLPVCEKYIDELGD